MHYRAVIKGSDLDKVIFNLTADGQFGRAKIIGEDAVEETVNFQKLDGHRVRITQECFEEDCIRYPENKQYDFVTLPYMITAVCAKYGFSQILIGNSKHTISIYDQEKPGRFIPVVENSVTYLHDREGLVFRREGDFYNSQLDEFVADILISSMEHTLRFFDQAYLIRFNLNGKFFYFPLADVYATELTRELKYRNLPEYKEFDWAGKLKELNEFPEKVTRPNINKE